MLLYQDRLTSLLNAFALQAFVLSLSVAWQAYVQNAPHLYLTAGIALSVKAVIIPLALRRIIRRLGIHREIETAINVGPTSSDERRVGKRGVSTCRSGWWPYNEKKK